MYKNIFLFALMFFSVQVYADKNLQDIKAEADSAYVQEKYEKAVQLYNLLVEENGIDAQISYNLGCAYYRMDSIANSILWFERAALLEPDDDDIIYNLDLLRTKTIDRIIPRHEMFFVSMYRGIVNMMSSYRWACMGITSFVLFLLGLTLFLYTTKPVLRKSGLCASVFFFLLTISSNVFAYQQHRYAEDRTRGIVMATSVTVRSTPSSSGNELFVLHEGTCVEVLDNAMKEWAQIRLSDGKQGWIEKSSFEPI